ncbi:MAG: M56 family metallopeptidase [Christensenellales bacterium]
MMTFLSSSLAAGALILLTALVRRFAGSRLPRRMYIAVVAPLIPSATAHRRACCHVQTSACWPFGETVTADMVDVQALSARPNGFQLSKRFASHAVSGRLCAFGLYFIAAYIRAARLRNPCGVTAMRGVLQAIRPAPWIRVRDCRVSYGLLHPVILGGLIGTACFSCWNTMMQSLDAWRKLLVLAALCLHWFNPAVFLLFLLVNRDMELLCDERVLSQCATSSKRAYALTLLEMEAARSAAPTMSCFRMTGIEERIFAMKNIMKNTPLTRLVAGSLVAASCFAMISAVPACADDKVFIVKAEDALVMREDAFVSSEDSLVLSTDTAEDSAYSYVVYNEETSTSESDVLPIEWWTVDEFENYMAQTRKDLEEMAQTGERGYTSTDGWFTWTQEKVEETMAVYEEMLAELKRGVKISKPFGSLSEGPDIVISQVPDSVASHNESTLMIDADTTLYLEKDGGRVFHSTPDCTAIPESARNALETFSADLLDQSPYSLLSACPVCFGTQGTEENGGNK